MIFGLKWLIPKDQGPELLPSYYREILRLSKGIEILIEIGTRMLTDRLSAL